MCSHVDLHIYKYWRCTIMYTFTINECTTMRTLTMVVQLRNHKLMPSFFPHVHQLLHRYLRKHKLTISFLHLFTSLYTPLCMYKFMWSDTPRIMNTKKKQCTFMYTACNWYTRKYTSYNQYYEKQQLVTHSITDSTSKKWKKIVYQGLIRVLKWDWANFGNSCN